MSVIYDIQDVNVDYLKIKVFNKDSIFMENLNIPDNKEKEKVEIEDLIKELNYF